VRVIIEKHSVLNAAGTQIAVITRPDETDYISLTDIAKRRNGKNPHVIIANWMRTRDTLDFPGLWERLHNTFIVAIQSRTAERLPGI